MAQYHHIVLFRMRDEASEADKGKMLEALRELGKNDKSIIKWEIEESLDARKGRIIIEDSVFTDEAAFQAFRTSAKHKKTSEIASKIADWHVGDYIA